MKFLLAALIPALAGLSSLACALETPLILTPQGTQNISTDLLLEINPNIGVMTYYQANLQSLDRATGHNFLTELDFRDKRLIKIIGGAPYSTLRVGSPNFKPTAQEFLDQFSSDHADHADPAVMSLREAATAAENAYWSKDHAYDGVVRAAWNGEYAVLVIPSKHAILFYSTSDRGTELIGWTSYGPQLLVQSSFNSNPSPQEVFKELPQLEQDKLLLAQKKKNEENIGKIKETPKSEAWVCAGQGNVFLIVDTANNILFSYEVGTKQIRLISVRNMSCELALPAEQNFQSTPKSSDMLSQYMKQNSRDLAAAGLAFSNLYEMKAYLKANTHGRASATGLQANALLDKVVLDFTEQHKMLTYSLSTTSTDLISARDYSMDLAIMVLDAALESKADAQDPYGRARANLQDHDFCINQLKLALALDPTLVKKLAKDQRIVSALKDDAGWGPLLDQANKDLDAQIAMMKQVKLDAIQMQKDDEQALKDSQDPANKKGRGNGGDNGGGNDNGNGNGNGNGNRNGYGN
jgi:hypothetical protein